MKILVTGVACALTWAFAACADDKPPVPKVYQGLATQKGQWKVDFLEATGRGREGQKPPSMTLCSDNLANQARKNAAGAKTESECKYKVLKDSSSESIVESTCKDRTMTVRTTRENDKTLIMEMDGKGGAGGPTHMKLRYAYLGACREGQGVISLDRNSEQCQKLRERMAKTDPEKQCAKSSQREQCLQQMQAAQKQAAAMCN
jgi:hypothetical protein